ncbi:MAG: hypothetical protein ACXAEU_11545 [Candidatus Hodarchaeales archaeon]|jgi:hypothetical protein
MSFNGKFYAMSVSVNSQPLVYAKRSTGSEFTDSKLGSLAMLGTVPGSTIRGWLRAGINKLLIAKGIKGVHPLMKISISSKNKQLFDQDLQMGYIPRDAADVEKHPVFQLFGTLGQPGNLGVSPVYFYPTSGAGAFKIFNDLFNDRIGTGIVETGFNSPACQRDSSQRFLKTESLRFRMIQAPIQFRFWKNNPIHETLLVMGIDYLNQKNGEQKFDFLLGGNRRNGSGEVRVRLSDNLRCKSNNTGLDKETFEKYQERFEKLVKDLRENFELENDTGEKGSSNEGNESNKLIDVIAKDSKKASTKKKRK